MLQTYTVNGIDEVASNDIAKKNGSSQPKVTLSFEMTRSGLVQLNKAEVKIDELMVIEERILRPPKNVTVNETLNETSAENATNSTESEEKAKKTRKYPHTYPLYKIEKAFYGIPTLNKEQLQTAKDRLKWFERRDDDKVKTDRVKNDFEAIIYSMRDWLSEGENTPFVGEEQQEAALQTLRDDEEWLLEGEGEHATHVEYTEKYNVLNRKYKQYKYRKEEHGKRDEAVTEARRKLTELEESTQELVDRKTWISKEQKEDMLERIADAKKWLEERVEKQKEVKTNEDPAFAVADIDQRITRLNAVFTKLASIPKPKEEKKKKKKLPKNIKIDNMTFDGNQDIDWGDFIKINNGDADDEQEEEHTQQNTQNTQEQEPPKDDSQADL